MQQHASQEEGEESVAREVVRRSRLAAEAAAATAEAIEVATKTVEAVSLASEAMTVKIEETIGVHAARDHRVAEATR